MCDTPHYVKVKTPKIVDGRYTDEIPVSCGKCPVCRKDRLRQWIFRLRQEDKVSISSHFVTLTYSPWNVPRTKTNLKTIKKKDIQDFMKRLRKRQPKKSNKIKYYIVGEYGGQTERPHYHGIIFNVEDVEDYAKAWKNGTVHIGTVKKESIAYTLDYMDKDNMIPKFKGDNRQKEFRLLSTGLGKSYITENVKNYHRNNPDRPYLIQDGFKVKMPRYYKDKIFSEQEKETINQKIQEYYKKERDKKEEKLNRKGKDILEREEQERHGRYERDRNKRGRNKI